MAGLPGIMRKIQTAEGELRNLESSVRAFLVRLQGNSLDAYIDPDTKENVVKLRICEHPDPVWGVRIGCITHMLRSSLDNLVWQLALLQTPNPYDKTAFPIYASAPDPNRFGVGTQTAIGALQSVSPVHRAAIEATQPYHQGLNSGRDPLWLLHELSNTDKHRTIPIVSTQKAGHAVSIKGPTGREPWNREEFISMMAPALRRLEDGMELARTRPEMKPDPRVLFGVGFGEGCPAIAGRDLLSTMWSIHERVRCVIGQFARDLRQPMS